MSQPVVVDEAHSDHRAPGWWRRRRRPTIAGAVLVGALVVGGGLTVARDSGRASGGGYGIRGERPVGERVWTVLVHGRTAPRGVVTIDRVEPDLLGDEAALEVEYVICHLDADALGQSGVGSSGYGVRDADVRRFCTHLVPAEGSAIELGTQPGQDLLVSVRSTRPGRSIVDSHRIEFSEGWQRGTADIQVAIDLTSR